MSRLAQSMRLGVIRGWRLQVVNDVKLFSISVIHCMFIYTVLRSKAFRLGLWIVSYFIKCLLKKYIIHIFFWRLPDVEKNRLFKLGWKVRVRFKRSFKEKFDATPIRLQICPTRYEHKALKFWEDKKDFVVNTNSGVSSQWYKGQLFFRYLWAQQLSLNFNKYSAGFGLGASSFNLRTHVSKISN